MPQVKIPVTRFRELHMGATERDFLHHFGEALVLRGFRLVRGRWIRDEYGNFAAKVDQDGNCMVPEPPLIYDRKETVLVITQHVPFRVPSANVELMALLNQVAVGNPGATAQLHGFLLSQGDDRADVLARLSADVPEDAMMTPDSGTATGVKNQLPDDSPLVPSTVIADRMLREKILLLFGAREEPL